MKKLVPLLALVAVPAGAQGSGAGERPVRQILADLSSSKHVGLLYRGQVISSTNLAGAASSIGELRACSRRAIAAN